MVKYQSAEEKYFGKEAPLGYFLREAGKTSYGAVAGVLRLPTTLRKSLNKQTKLQREVSGYRLSESLGVLTGYIGGCMADIYLAKYALQEFSKDNCVPAIIFGATNLASLFFEFGRYSKMEKRLKELDC